MERRNFLATVAGFAAAPLAWVKPEPYFVGITEEEAENRVKKTNWVVCTQYTDGTYTMEHKTV